MGTLRCVESFAFSDGGVERVIRAGDIVDDKSPFITAGRRQWFEPVEVSAERFTDRRRERSTGAPSAKKAPAAKKAAAKDED